MALYFVLHLPLLFERPDHGGVPGGPLHREQVPRDRPAVAGAARSGRCGGTGSGLSGRPGGGPSGVVLRIAWAHASDSRPSPLQHNGSSPEGTMVAARPATRVCPVGRLKVPGLGFTPVARRARYEP